MVNCRALEIAGKPLVVWEHDDVIDAGTGNCLTGSWVWDCALVFAHWLGTPAWGRNALDGKRVVELGAGTGLPGLAAAIFGAQVVLTDRRPLLPGLERNVVANNLSSRVQVQELEWGESCAHLCPPVDYVFMSDLLYDVDSMAALCKTLIELSDRNTQILLSYELRPGTTECFQEFGRQGLVWSKVPTEELHPDWNSEDIGIFRIWREA
ncbi:hypothetical protein MPTK1_6g12820 [Marchantia polymorpha subsp. ruderalis]|uniref:Uncharacterized protein n=2 Tax=Marchantia polymorpha TaxID=3197 RepID=A0AAF6BRE8_MARPO|nr:hypothetical protein MARPO_0059s0066 [Marchantia polymorpha]BBN14582.1 hypothetical protein Mp_6g12820 [Marchantia polymorpha subsp. ruderalis]|eukprot:PTQ37139.1 hypothetical protein MARPO_0059s0066 [Marchantia polymorpha]